MLAMIPDRVPGDWKERGLGRRLGLRHKAEIEVLVRQTFWRCRERRSWRGRNTAVTVSWRRRPGSNRCLRICNPLRNHSATSPSPTAKSVSDGRPEGKNPRFDRWSGFVIGTIEQAGDASPVTWVLSREYRNCFGNCLSVGALNFRFGPFDPLYWPVLPRVRRSTNSLAVALCDATEGNGRTNRQWRSDQVTPPPPRRSPVRISLACCASLPAPPAHHGLTYSFACRAMGRSAPPLSVGLRDSTS